MIFNYGTIELFNFLPLEVYWSIPLVAIIMAVFFQQLVQKVAQIYEDFKDILHLMCRKGRSRKGLRYRSLMSASILGLRVILPGGCSNAVKRGFKFKYLYYVMDRTVWFVMAAPVRYLLIR